MDEKRTQEPEFSEDSLLDSAVREATRARAQDVEMPDDAALLEYLAGEADEQLTSSLRRRIAESPALRRRVAEIAEDVGRLQDPAVRAAFDERSADPAPSLSSFLRSRSAETTDARRPETAASGALRGWQASLSAWFERFFLSFRTPAFAGGFVSCLLLFAILWAVDRGGSGDLVLETQSVSLTPALRLRGAEPSPAVTVELAEKQEWLELTLRASTRSQPGIRHRLTIFAGDEVLWRNEDFRSIRGMNGWDAYELLLDADLLPAGEIRIEAERYDRESGELLFSDTYRLEVSAR
jgi:hypothetical protein